MMFLAFGAGLVVGFGLGLAAGWLSKRMGVWVEFH